MLRGYPRNWKLGAHLAQGAWIDLCDAASQEKSTIEKTFGLRVPTREELSEIETTSRLRKEPEALYMSAPLIAVAEDGPWSPAPTGFILSKKVLITIHFDRLAPIDAVAQKLGATDKIEPVEVFTRILEELVDRAADHLELSAEHLDKASRVIFRDEQKRASRLSHDANLLRNAITQIGRTSHRISNVQYMMTWLDRISKFTSDHGHEWIAGEIIERLQAVRTDITSLSHFDESLLSRVQLLQDAATAFISIGQNEVMKVLTVVSVAGVPPVLIAGIYGMNFKNMPELNWPWGYGFALVLIVASTVIPLIWFKLKDWI